MFDQENPSYDFRRETTYELPSHETEVIMAHLSRWKLPVITRELTLKASTSTVMVFAISLIPFKSILKLLNSSLISEIILCCASVWAFIKSWTRWHINANASATLWTGGAGPSEPAWPAVPEAADKGAIPLPPPPPPPPECVEAPPE